MKTLFFDSTGGASGDMILGALIHLGVSRDQIMNGLSGLRLGYFDIRACPFKSHGLNGIRVKVKTDPDTSCHERGLREIESLIQQSGLPESVRSISVRVFQRLAEAEAKVHDTAPEDIHFHELGAVDSIVDIAASCLALDMLNIGGVAVGPLPLGSGVTECSHGTIPVPAPATLELLKDMPLNYTDEPFELVTPTGAALLSEWKTADRPPPGSSVIAAGYGFGHRVLSGRPNLLRAAILENPKEPKPFRNECLVLECNMDDCSPEILGSLAEKLIRAGALDVFTTSVFMKKQRPGVLLTILSNPELRDDMLDLVFRESTTFGVREYPVQRAILDRQVERVETVYGAVRIKCGIWKGRMVTRSPEHEDCARLADKTGVPVRTVHEAALLALTGPAGSVGNHSGGQNDHSNSPRNT